MRKLIVIVMLLFISGCAYAQQTSDIGVQVAAATYWGDIQKVDYSKSISPMFGLFGRWNFNKRLAIRGQLLTGNLQAQGLFSNSYIDQPSYVPTTVPPTYQRDLTYAYSFSRSIQTVEGLFEFNFRNYKLGNMKKEAFTPFLALGVGVLYSRAPLLNSFILDPNPAISANPLATPPVPFDLYSPFVDGDNKKTNGFDVLTLTIPVGAGLKFNLTKRLGGMVEMMVRKTFSDNIDNLNDPKRYQNPISSGTVPVLSYSPAVSGLNNNDWFATFAFSLSYQIGSDVGDCSVYHLLKNRK
jgi:hypothetical protein